MKKNSTQKIVLFSRCSWTLYNFRAGLIRVLKDMGKEVVGGGAGGDGFEARIEALGVSFRRLPVDKKGLNPLADVRLLAAILRWYWRERPGIVHHFTIKPVIYGSIAARLVGVPRIVNTVTGLGYVFTGDEPLWLHRLVELLYRVALHCADFTFFQNRDDLEYFLRKRLVPPARAGLLPGSGVNCNHFKPTEAEGAKTDGQVTFLMVSRLLRDKGVYEFVEAARRVRNRHARTCFALLGMRDERNPTVVPERDLNRWQAEGIVQWWGSAVDVRPLLSAADVVVLPSYYREGVPRSLLEAAAMAKPIITTDAVGCREVVEHGRNGLLVPVKDPAALSRAMLRMIEDPDGRRSMGRAGREKVKRQFNEKDVIAAVLETYQPEGPGARRRHAPGLRA